MKIEEDYNVKVLLKEIRKKNIFNNKKILATIALINWKLLNIINKKI